MMPCALMLSASSYSAPSSMRVRGWYLPGTSSSSCSEAGRPALAPAPSASPAACSCTVGPSRASRPRPRPLGFLVTMVRLSPDRPTSDRSVRADRRSMACLGPVAQAGVGVDVAARADVDDSALPQCRGQFARRARTAAKRVVRAGHQRRCETAAACARSAPSSAVAGGRSSRSTSGGRHQQRALHAAACCANARPRPPPACSPGCARPAPPARRSASSTSSSRAIQSPRSGRIQSCCSTRAVAVQALPAALPVVRPAVLPAGQDQDAGVRAVDDIRATWRERDGLLCFQ